MSLLSDWRGEVETSFASPWPGPRPMRAGRDDPSALVGRSQDSGKFARLVYDTDVVIFTGASGVGKTSMLQLNLVPTLKAAGYEPLVVDDWNRSSEANSVDDLVFGRVKGQLPPRAKHRTTGGASLLESLDHLYPDHSVIILDQFEELIRYQPKEYQKVLRWIEKAVSETRVRIVVSLRAEYEHELRGPHGLRLGPFQQERYELKPITDRSLLGEVVERGNANRTAKAIHSEAVERLLDAWSSAEETTVPGDRGLLHLQALLFVLWMTKAEETIQPTDIDTLVRALFSEDEVDASTGMPADESVLFKRALSEAVRVALEKCSAACEPNMDGTWQGLDPVLVSRTREYVQAMSGYLSSGGYKVSQAREDLAHFVIFREGTSALARYAARTEKARQKLAELVDLSTPSPMHGHSASEDVPDWLSAPRSELFGAEPLDERPWDGLDEADLTGGVLLGLRPEDSLLEEFRSFYFALEWLRLCELIRLTTPYRGKTMVTLIHDLFGDGLVEWSRSTTRGADAATHQFAAIRGVQMNWKSAGVPSTIQEPVVANLRWRSCEITADFSGVTFVNCDFRGTTFVDSSFEGVSFVNCMLDDAEFLNCRIIGSASPPTPPSELSAERPPPSFFIPHAPRSLLESLAWHREPRRDGAANNMGLYSRTAGIAAVPAGHRADPEQMFFEPEPGGLSMFGGRVSSLKVRACDFGDDGQLALRHVAGTSVEFADQVHARLDVYGAAIRGLTITRPVDGNAREFDANTSAQIPDPLFDISFTDSRIINVWFGVGLRGVATFVDCRVWHVFNAADRAEFVVTMPNSQKPGHGTRAYGVINIEPLDPGQEMSLGPESLGALRDEVWQASRTIDYRRRPVPFELAEDPGS